MKKLILIFFCSVSLFYAQTEQRGIELPDFVITGRQSVEVQAAQKNKPELVSTLSEEFFTPAFSPEELPLLFSSIPTPIQPDISASGDYYSGSLNIGLGRYSFPTGNLFLNKSFNHYLVSLNAWGSNLKPYIENAGYNNSGLKLENNFFISTKSDFIPGTKFKLGGEYSRDSYKYYGSIIPTTERKNERGNLEFEAKNTFNRWVNFKLNLSADFLNTNNNSLKEKNLNLESLFEIKLGKMIAGGNAFYRKQLLDGNLSGVDSYDYYSLDGYAKIYPMNNLIVTGGINLAGNGGNMFFSPFGTLQYRIFDGLSLNAGFKPHTKFYSIKDFLNNNIYMLNLFTDNVFSEVVFDFDAKLRYEYEKIFAIDFWSRYSKTDNYLYFEDTFNTGFFLVQTSDAKSISGGINFLLYPNEYGYLSGELRLQNIKDSNKKYIPYKPLYYLSVAYGYDFSFGLGLKASYKYASGSYADILNNFEMPDYYNLSFRIDYKIWESLSISGDFQNILNRSNFVLYNYEEKPMDLILGIQYRW